MLLNLKETEKFARQIVASIEKYYREKGECPQVLEDLVPGYIDEIPVPSWGNSGWIYELLSQGFYFGVGYGQGKDLYPVIFFSYPEKHWIVDF